MVMPEQSGKLLSTRLESDLTCTHLLQNGADIGVWRETVDCRCRVVDNSRLEEFLLLHRGLRRALEVYVLPDEVDDHAVDVKCVDLRVRQKTHALIPPLRVVVDADQPMKSRYAKK
jgi:hypothetical protein